MDKRRKNYFLKPFLGFLLISFLGMPVSAHTGADHQPAENKENTEKKYTDPVLTNRATRTVFKISQGLPAAYAYFFAPAAKQETKSPHIVIEADNLFFNDTTGDILASGQVFITKDGVKIATDQLTGNKLTGQVWTDKPISYSYERSYLTSAELFYDYQTKSGYLGETKGRINRQFVTGKHIEILPDHYVIDQATATGCPAKIPDYHVSAEKIEIWPDDKMIMHKAKFWIKNKLIFTMDRYQSSLKPEDEDKPAFPKIGYRSSDGFYISQYLAYPVSPTTNFFADIAYYSKWDFRPTIGISDRQKNYTTQIIYGHFSDIDDNWVKKSPEFSWTYHSRHIGSTPLTYGFNFSYGKWVGNDKTSWHQSYTFSLNHDPIRLSNSSFLYFGGAIEHQRESYDHSHQNIPRFDITLTKAFSPSFNAWVSYHYKNYQQQPLFNYGVPEISQEINYGFTYKIDRLNTIGLTYRYNNETHKLDDIYYTWYRNLHCWESALTYKSKAHSWHWTINMAHW